MKIEKGTPGYLNARKIRLLLLTLLEFAIVIALLVLGYMQTGTRLNLDAIGVPGSAFSFILTFSSRVCPLGACL